MATNIEIKARLTDAQYSDLQSKVSSMVERSAVLLQTDTFFSTSGDRLKLREFSDESAELIAYSRNDETGPKLSDYIRTPIAHPKLLKESLVRSVGLRGVVKKRRQLFLIDQTRVHLDEVQGLGKFVELEVVMRPEQSITEGQQIATEIMATLGIPDDGLVSAAYIDLLDSMEIDSGVKITS